VRQRRGVHLRKPFAEPCAQCAVDRVEARADAGPAVAFRQRDGAGYAHGFDLQRAPRIAIALARECAEVHLAHARVECRQHALRGRRRARGERKQRRHRQHGNVQGQRDALRDRHAQAHAGERAGTAPHRDRVELRARDAGFGEQRLGPWQREFRMPARRDFEALDDLAVAPERHGAGFGGKFEGEEFHRRSMNSMAM